MADWVSIDPALTVDGAFVALSQLPHAEELKPVPLAQGQPEFGTWWNRELQYDFSIAAQLGITNIADVSTSFKSRTIAYDVVLYSEELRSSPNGGLIYGTRWGAGLRTRIDVTNFDAKFDLTIGNVAAAASIGLVNASFSIQGLGISDPSILKLLPGPGRFDDQSYAQIRKAIDAAIRDILLPKKGLVSMPFMIFVLDPGQTFAGPLDRSRSRIFAMRRVRDGVSQTVAVESAMKVGLDQLSVQAVYTQWAKTSVLAPNPTDAARRRAKAWLDRINLG